MWTVQSNKCQTQVPDKLHLFILFCTHTDWPYASGTQLPNECQCQRTDGGLLYCTSISWLVDLFVCGGDISCLWAGQAVRSNSGWEHLLDKACWGKGHKVFFYYYFKLRIYHTRIFAAAAAALVSFCYYWHSAAQRSFADLAKVGPHASESTAPLLVGAKQRTSQVALGSVADNSF